MTIRRQDYALAAAIVCLGGLAVTAFVGALWWAVASGVFAVASVIAARFWSAQSPTPVPAALRWSLFLVPHGSQCLNRMLRPERGERILEVGPGVGHHALAVAPLLGPRGALHVMDIQDVMLASLIGRATAAALANIVPLRGDAQRVPYCDRAFDAVYLSAVLGEIPDRGAALREIRRVLKPDGRLVIAEALLDPDYVSLSTLRQETTKAGFAFDGKIGLGIAYIVRFRGPVATHETAGQA